MSNNLANWVKERISDLYKARNDKEFNEAFEAFVARDVSITVNGKNLSRAQYKKLIRGEVNDDGANVSFADIVAVPNRDHNNNGTGSVGVFFRVEGANDKITHSLNVVVIDNPDHHQGDTRRASHINEVISDEHNRIAL